MSLLLPQIRAGTVRSIRPVDIHSDRYVDLVVLLDGAGAVPITGRVSATECPLDLTLGERVKVNLTMGVITSVSRA